MMHYGALLLIVALTLAAGAKVSAQLQRAAPSPRPPSNGNWLALQAPAAGDSPRVDGELTEWKLETVTLRDGRRFAGLILSDSGEYLELDEVRREAGKSMYVIKRRFPLALVAQSTRIEDQDRQRLADQLQKHRNRHLEETQRMAEIAIQPGKSSGGPAWNYRSPWFDLRSRMDEDLTRRAIVRIEAMFAAFAVILPSSSTPRRDRLKIELFDTNDSYLAYQQVVGVKLRHPAFYLREQNLLAAGADLSALAQNLANVRGKNAATKAKLDELAKDLKSQLQKASQEFTQQGRNPEDVKQLVQLLQTKLQKELSSLQNDLQTAERKNAQHFEQFTKAMFQRLYHEAFHAYLENFVFPAAEYDVPRWLNEGLAQVFEEGILEAGTLRLDIPSQKRLTAFQKDLREQDRLPLAELLNSEPRRFLVAHEDQALSSERLYLYSWGLAHYLVIREPVLQGKVLAKYVDQAQTAVSPQQRFEQMVGQPLDEFEKKWRAAMLYEAK